MREHDNIPKNAFNSKFSDVTWCIVQRNHLSEACVRATMQKFLERSFLVDYALREMSRSYCSSLLTFNQASDDVSIRKTSSVFFSSGSKTNANSSIEHFKLPHKKNSRNCLISGISLFTLLPPGVKSWKRRTFHIPPLWKDLKNKSLKKSTMCSQIHKKKTILQCRKVFSLLVQSEEISTMAAVFAVGPPVHH